MSAAIDRVRLVGEVWIVRGRRERVPLLRRDRRRAVVPVVRARRGQRCHDLRVRGSAAPIGRARASVDASRPNGQPALDENPARATAYAQALTALRC